MAGLVVVVVLALCVWALVIVAAVQSPDSVWQAGLRIVFTMTAFFLSNHLFHHVCIVHAVLCFHAMPNIWTVITCC